MLGRILLVLLILFLIWLAIKILVRAIPEMFSNQNRRNIRGVSTSGGFQTIIPTGSNLPGLAKTLLFLNFMPLAVSAAARREQVLILRNKINQFTGRRLTLEKMITPNLPSLVKLLDDQLEEWRSQVDNMEFEFVNLNAAIDHLQRNYRRFIELYQQLDSLLSDCFRSLSQAASIVTDQSDLDALRELETEFGNCQKATFTLGKYDDLEILFAAIKEKEKILREYVGNEQGTAGGNQPFAEKKDYYNILGVAHDAADMDIKAGYRREIGRWHPDKKDAEVNKITDPDVKDQVVKEFERRFREAQEAYEVLSDPQKRAAYDKT